jgi:hypothetical protein
MGSLFIPPFQQESDANGSPLSGAKQYFYVTGTSTPATVYSTADLSVELANPVVADSAGRFPPIYLDGGVTYRVVLTTSSGVPIGNDIDPYSPGAGSGGGTVATADELSMADFPLIVPEANDQPRFERANAAALAAGKGLFFPPGSYTLGEDTQNGDPTNAGTLKSYTRLRGVRGTVLIYRDDTKPFTMFGNPVGIGAIGSPDVVDYDDPRRLKNISIKGLSFMRPVLPFYEQSAHIHISGVDNLLIEDCECQGADGDWLTLGSGDIGGGSQARYNRNVTIRNCDIRGNAYDGPGGNNRNAISVIDCDGLVITDNYFANWTRPGGAGAYDADDPQTSFPQPGFIDLEPNQFNAGYINCRNVTITRNKFVNGGSGGVTLNLPAHAICVNPVQGFNIYDNEFVDVVSDLIVQTDSTGVSYNINFYNNKSTGGLRPFDLLGCNGVTISKNYYYNKSADGYFGYPGRTDNNVTIEGNTFELCGVGLGAFEILSQTTDFKITNNIFKDTGDCAFAVLPPGDIIQRGVIEGNRIIKTPGAAKVINYSIKLNPYAADVGNVPPVIDNSSITERNNDWAGLLALSTTQGGAFIVNGSSTKRVDVSGRWVQGNEIYNPTAEPGAFERAVVIADSSPIGAGTRVNPKWAIYLRGGGQPDPTPGTVTSLTLAGLSAPGKGRLTASNASGVAYSASYLDPQSTDGFVLMFRSSAAGPINLTWGITSEATPSATDPLLKAFIIGNDMGNMRAASFTSTLQDFGNSIAGDYWLIVGKGTGAPASGSVKVYKIAADTVAPNLGMTSGLLVFSGGNPTGGWLLQGTAMGLSQPSPVRFAVTLGPYASCQILQATTIAGTTSGGTWAGTA